MEKRKLISLRAVLLGYLVQTAVSCIVAAVLWLLLFFLCIIKVAPSGIIQL